MQSLPFEDFGASLKNYFNNTTLSDATIRCGGRFFSVHSLVLFCHSEYFKKELDGPWKESLGREIHILDFAPPVVEAMILFFYHFDYDSKDSSSEMSFHAKVYQIADKYGIEALKKLAATKYRASVEAGWEMESFPEAIALTYTTTPSADRGLRDIAVEVAFKHIGPLMGQDAFCGMLSENPDVAADVIRFMHGQMGMAKENKCSGCKRVFLIAAIEPRDGPFHFCPKCKTANYGWR
ncbi:ARM repeat protein [Fusarium phyllophilum]|uniref:ARM repeat protein n=1 Tax=Fusarium phyllophilum TaxID=47803 RepID=A0A8H5NDC3_9HYPO|nr:ARM repeat protein [Fusarium phyllophilum]